MRNILVIAISLILLTSGTALAAKGGNPEPPAAGNMELVGFTTATTAPNVGLFAMTNLCQVEFLDSRMCTSEEIMKTVNIPELPTGTVAWAQPVVTGAFHETAMIRVDISGLMRSDLNCDGWTSTNTEHDGLIVTDIGKIDILGCYNRQLPVACCAPAQ